MIFPHTGLILDEKGGSAVEKRPNKHYAAPIICGIAVAVVALIYVALGVAMALAAPIALPVVLLVIALPAAVLFGIIYVTLERIKEIKGGEEDDSRNY